MLLNQLGPDDYFSHGGSRWRMIDLIKVGCCHPQFNAQNIDDEEVLAFFHGEYEVEKIFRFRTHPDYIFPAIADNEFIETDPSIPLLVDILVPTVQDRFIQYEDSDTWLLYFDLATIEQDYYYEEWVNGKWERGDWVGI